MVRIGETWPEIVDAFENGGPVQSLYALGGTDTGKSTFCRFLTERARAAGSAAHIDCDTGQSSIGPPATVGLAVYGTSPAMHLRFVGSTSPQGHLLQTLAGARRLLDTALEAGVCRIVIDSPGFIYGDAAIEFQFQMIDLLQPDHIVVFQRGRELEGLIANFLYNPEMAVHRVKISPAVVRRSAAERRKYRLEQFAAYFADLQPQEIVLGGLGLHGMIPDFKNRHEVANRLFALCDHRQSVVALGIADAYDAESGCLFFHSPGFDPCSVSSIQFGSMGLCVGEPPVRAETIQEIFRIR
jgi:polynucleotide 5'-hydroxyl-kinase GRC3/NOL9